MRQPYVRTLSKDGGGNYSTGKNAVGICHRSGFKFPYQELVFEPGTNFLVHKSETDGGYSLVAHPQNYPPEKLTENIALKWSFPDVALSLGAVVSSTDLYRIKSLTSDVGIHLDFINNHYYSRSSNGNVVEANFATFANYRRSGVASYLGSDGLIKYAGPNEPRIEYDENGNVLGYLVESSAANLILHNTDVNTSPWGGSNTNVQVNAGLAPDGTMTADRVVPVSTGTSVAHNRGQSITTVLSNAYTFSFYAKADGINSLLIQMKNGAGTNSFENIIDITATPSIVSRYAVGTGVNISTSVETMLDNWILVKGTGIFGATDTSNIFTVFPLNANREVFYVATSEAGFYLWGAQVEQGETATSMIPTTTAIGTRSNDYAKVQMPVDVYATTQGTVFAHFTQTRSSVTGTNQFIYHINNQNYTNTINLGEQNGRLGQSVNANGGFNGNATCSVKHGGSETKIVSTWSDNNVTITRNALETTIDAIASVPEGYLPFMNIGSDHNGFNNCFRTHIKKLDYWPYKKGLMEAIELTSVA